MDHAADWTQQFHYGAIRDNNTLMVFLGLSLLADGIMNLITVLLTVKIIHHQYPDVIDAEFWDEQSL